MKQYTDRIYKLWNNAGALSDVEEVNYIGTEHVLLAFFVEDDSGISLARKALENLGVTKESLSAEIQKMRDAES